MRACELRTLFNHWWVSLHGGIVSTLFGHAALHYYPKLSLLFAILWVAWRFLASGVFGITASIYERRLGSPWAWTLVFGILGVATGVFALLAPPATLTAIMGPIAGFALVSAIIFCFGAFNLAQIKEDFMGGRSG